MENLAGKFLVDNDGTDRKIRGLVLASLSHLVFTGEEIKSGPLEYYIDRDGKTYCTFYLDDKIFLDEDQLTEDEVNKFLEEVEEKMPTMIQIKNYISTWVENNMTTLNLHILKRYPKYPGYEEAVREYKEYISCPEKTSTWLLCARNPSAKYFNKIINSTMLTRAALIIHGAINRKDHDNREG